MDPLLTSLRRSPFSGGDTNDVFGQLDGIATTPVSAIEDIGITPELISYINNGLLNADFRTPPPDTSAVLDDIENKLPGWSYSQTGTTVTAQWVSNTVKFSVAAGAPTGDTAYIEQIVPLGPRSTKRTVFTAQAAYSATGTTPGVYLYAQYVKSDGTTTGTLGDSFYWGNNSPIQATPNGESGPPSDAIGLRVRIGATDGSANAGTASYAYVNLAERVVIEGPVLYYPLTAAADDFYPSGLEGCQIIHFYSLNGASRNVTGIDSTNMPIGRILWLYNGDDTDNVVLKHASASSSANNRFLGPSASDVTIHPYGGCMVILMTAADGTSLKRWRFLSDVA